MLGLLTRLVIGATQDARYHVGFHDMELHVGFHDMELINGVDRTKATTPITHTTLRAQKSLNTWMIAEAEMLLVGSAGKGNLGGKPLKKKIKQPKPLSGRFLVISTLWM